MQCDFDSMTASFNRLNHNMTVGAGSPRPDNLIQLLKTAVSVFFYSEGAVSAWSRTIALVSETTEFRYIHNAQFIP